MAQVSNLGRFRSSKGIVTTPKPRVDGYSFVQVDKNLFQLHRLIATSFELHKPPGANIVNHIDGNPKNNSLDNLEWVTHSQNIQHARDSKIYKKPVPKDDVDQLPGESWRETFGGAMVSNLGRLRTSTGITKRPRPHPSGYVRVMIKKKNFQIHRLIAEAFQLPKPSAEHNQINHLDGDPLNNCVSNLAWCTASENIQHSHNTNKSRASNATRQSKPVMARPICSTDWTRYDSTADAARKLNVDQGSICKAANGQRKRVGNYEFTWAEANEPPLMPNEIWVDVVKMQ
tara:strand:+ start:194 stop:1054 length:861 start_codon:yes stop_codon:yes gene_type:complete